MASPGASGDTPVDTAVAFNSIPHLPSLPKRLFEEVKVCHVWGVWACVRDRDTEMCDTLFLNKQREIRM